MSEINIRFGDRDDYDSIVAFQIKMAHETEGKELEPKTVLKGVQAVFDDEKKEWKSVDNMQNLQAAQGAGIQSAANVVNAGCGILICGHCGPKAFNVLKEAAVEVYLVNGGTIEEAVLSCRKGVLTKLDEADVEGHW